MPSVPSHVPAARRKPRSALSLLLVFSLSPHWPAGHIDSNSDIKPAIPFSAFVRCRQVVFLLFTSFLSFVLFSYFFIFFSWSLPSIITHPNLFWFFLSILSKDLNFFRDPSILKFLQYWFSQSVVKILHLKSRLATALELIVRLRTIPRRVVHWISLPRCRGQASPCPCSHSLSSSVMLSAFVVAESASP